jgi:hypothetical protein
MPSELPPFQDFSKWDGTSFFKDDSNGGRRVYVVKKNEQGVFDAYGVIEPNNQFVFRVRGTSASELEKFVAEMKIEHAPVTYGTPPFETQTGGDKPPPTGPVGAKSSAPPIRPQ